MIRGGKNEEKDFNLHNNNVAGGKFCLLFKKHVPRIW